jgi:hypothetical protein
MAQIAELVPERQWGHDPGSKTLKLIWELSNGGPMIGLEPAMSGKILTIA